MLMPAPGGRIVFDSTRDAANAIYLMRADRSRLLRITDNEAWHMAPAREP